VVAETGKVKYWGSELPVSQHYRPISARFHGICDDGLLVE
jgi:hypothetical protein